MAKKSKNHVWPVRIELDFYEDATQMSVSCGWSGKRPDDIRARRRAAIYGLNKAKELIQQGGTFSLGTFVDDQNGIFRDKWVEKTKEDLEQERKGGSKGA